MRSQLTPAVFRAILDNRPYFHSRCRRQLSCLLATDGRKRRAGISQQRTIFGISALGNPQAKDNRAADDGLQQMKEFMRALNERSRPPQPYALASAFMAFIHGQVRSPGKLTHDQVGLLHLTFKHLLREPHRNAEGSIHTRLGSRDLEDVLSALVQAEFEAEALEMVGGLARLVFQELCGRIESVDPRGGQPGIDAVSAYISILSHTGSPMDALATLESHWRQGLHSRGILPWAEIIKGLAKTDKLSLIPEITEKMDLNGAILDQQNHEILTLAVAEECSASVVRAVYETKILGDHRPLPTATMAAIKVAVRESEMPWATSLARELAEKDSKETADAVLLLAAARGEGGDALEATLERMVMATPGVRSTLTIDTFNTLLDFAITANNLGLVESYANIAKKWELLPDTRTYRMLMEARLRRDDVRGAVTLYQQLETEGLADQLDAPILNQLIIGLCYGDQLEIGYDVVLSVSGRLTAMEGRFDAKALGAVCNLMLSHHDVEGVSDLLRPIIDSYNTEELSLVRQGFTRYIFRAAEPAERLWEAYQLLNAAFPSTSVEVRSGIMLMFFRRQRSDLACLVFGHMRQKEYSETRPTAGTYALCFAGIAQAADTKGLHLVHNMLKLDLEVGITTEIRNGLMLAYAACGMSDQAMDYFRDILHSKEGPSEKTLSIFFRVCETFHNGVKEATKMMEKLESLDLHVDVRVYNAYIGALGGHCELERAADAIRVMQPKTGDPPSSFTLGTLYNAIPHQYWKDQAEEWARTTYPGLWDELEKTGRESDVHGNQTFNIDNSLAV